MASNISWEKHGTKPKSLQISKCKGPRFFKKFRKDELEKYEALKETIAELQGEYRERFIKIENFIKDDTVRIFGVQETYGEDLSAVVLRIFNDILKVRVLPGDLESCYRVENSDVKKCNSIIVRFLTVSTRNKILHAKTLLKKSGMAITQELSLDVLLLYKKAIKSFGVAKVKLDETCVLVTLPNKRELRFQSPEEIDDYKG